MPINNSAVGGVVDVVADVYTRWVLTCAASPGFDRTLRLDDARLGGLAQASTRGITPDELISFQAGRSEALRNEP